MSSNANSTTNPVKGNQEEENKPSKPLMNEVNKLDECLREMVLASGDLIINYLYSIDPNSITFPSSKAGNNQEVKKYPVQEDVSNLVRSLQTEWQMLDAVCDQMYFTLSHTKTSLEEELNLLNGNSQSKKEESKNKEEIDNSDREVSKKINKIQSLF